MDDDSNARIQHLEARVQALEAEFGRLRGQIPAPPSLLPPPPPPPTGRPLPPSLAGPDAWGGPPRLVPDSEAVLKWGGVGLVVLAVGFAVSTAISRGWIGPELQLVGAVGVSLALIGTGLRLRPTRLPWSHALCSGGVLALFTTAASDLFVDELNRDTAFVSTVVVGVAAVGLARLVPSMWVAGAALLGGIIGWFVIGDDAPPFHSSVAWSLVLVALTLTLALERGWFALRVGSHGVGILVALGMAGEADGTQEQVVILGAAAVLYGALVSLPSVGDLRSAWQQFDIQLAALAAPWAFSVLGITLDAERDTGLDQVAIGVAIGSLIVALIIREWIKPAHFVSQLLGASVTLSIGLAILLDATGAFVALAVQGAGLVVLSRFLDRNLRMLVNAAVLVFIAAAYVTVAMVDAWSDDVPVGDDIAHLAIIAAVALAGWQTAEEAVLKLTGAMVLVLGLIWLGSVLVHLPEGQAVVSVSWAVVGTAVLVTGALRKIPEFGAAGLAVLALTVGKLLTVDLQEVDTLWRAGLFFVVGLALMRLGFLLPRLTGVASEDADAPRQAPAETPPPRP